MQDTLHADICTGNMQVLSCQAMTASCAGMQVVCVPYVAISEAMRKEPSSAVK
jgi:hypothetical protein